jgi:hypothetical protein
VAGIIDPLALTLTATAHTATAASALVDGSVTAGTTPTAVGVAMDVLASSLAVVVETALLSRVFLVALLAERNDVIAENILAECRRIADEDRELELKERSKNGGVRNKRGSSTTTEVPRRSRAVVAVLGMAHCNGVQKIILGK